MVHELNEENFQGEVLESSLPVLVDFWAPWCPPCRVMLPIIEELSEEFADQVKIGRLNVDQAAETAARYSIQSIPTIVLFKDGAPKDTIVGAVTKEYIAGRIRNLIER
jgi:thioredoxin 1